MYITIVVIDYKGRKRKAGHGKKRSVVCEGKSGKWAFCLLTLPSAFAVVITIIVR